VDVISVGGCLGLWIFQTSKGSLYMCADDVCCLLLFVVIATGITGE